MIDRWLIARGPNTYLRIALPQFGRVSIGSAESCDLRIVDTAEEHVLLFLDHGLGAEVRAECAVNEKPLTTGARAELAIGDRLRLGGVILELGQGEEPSTASGEAAPIMNDPAMTLVTEQIEQAALSTNAVTILGETGTGKNLIAELIHARSSRAKLPLRTVAGAGVEAIESIAAEAKGGTIIVDELGGLEPSAQLAWRHAIERPPSGVRFIFLSNHDLAKEESLRKDLYFWLQRFVITLPPLRDRPRDLLPLAERFLARIDGSLALSDRAKQQLAKYTWPGNVRELLHMLERAVLRAAGDVIDDLDLPSGREATSRTLRDELATFERDRISAALAAHPTQAEAAKALGIPLRTLAYRMELLGLRRSAK